MSSFIDYIGTLQAHNKLPKIKLFLSAFGIFLFLSLLITLQIVNQHSDDKDNVSLKSSLAASAGTVPEFSIVISSVSHAYSTYKQVSSTEFTVDDANVNATVTDLGEGFWSLKINQAKKAITQVTFPSQSQRVPLDSDISDDVFYYPYIMGLTRKASNINTDGDWWGFEYPGSTALPLTVMADADNASIVAATNWPPKNVTPQFGAQRMVLIYNQSISVGGSGTYSALITTVTGSASTGNTPWQLALDKYKSWLAGVMNPPTYPSWMSEGQGMFGVQLQNLSTEYSTAYIDSIWQPVKSLYPWMLFWGQMDPYAGGCCELKYTMNARYLTAPTLPDYVKNTVVANGYHAGYYSAPKWSDNITYSLDKPAGVDWLTGWFNANRGYNANSFYIDTLARENWGQAMTVRGLMEDNTIPPESMIEGLVDIYPRAGPISGSLAGDVNGCGAPFKRPRELYDKHIPQFCPLRFGRPVGVRRT